MPRCQEAPLGPNQPSVIEREREDGGGRDKDREVGVRKRKAGRQREECRKSENKCRERRLWKPTCCWFRQAPAKLWAKQRRGGVTNEESELCMHAVEKWMWKAYREKKREISKHSALTAIVLSVKAGTRQGMRIESESES
jgi:hypothetical protein